jgi:hypothetical protein
MVANMRFPDIYPSSSCLGSFMDSFINGTAKRPSRPCTLSSRITKRIEPLSMTNKTCWMFYSGSSGKATCNYPCSPKRDEAVLPCSREREPTSGYRCRRCDRGGLSQAEPRRARLTPGALLLAPSTGFSGSDARRISCVSKVAAMMRGSARCVSSNIDRCFR